MKTKQEKLFSLLNSESSINEMLIKDMFALGCYLCWKGEVSAGKKFIKELKSIFPKKSDKKIIDELLKDIELDAEILGQISRPHNEILRLFPKQ